MGLCWLMGLFWLMVDGLDSVGVVAGLDFALSNNFSIGADFRYMINLTASEESEFLSAQYRASGLRSIEESNYYVVGASIKLLF